VSLFTTAFLLVTPGVTNVNLPIIKESSWVTTAAALEEDFGRVQLASKAGQACGLLAWLLWGPQHSFGQGQK